jgi:hypothetical protein
MRQIKIWINYWKTKMSGNIENSPGLSSQETNPIELPKDKRGRISWRLIKDDQPLLDAWLRQECLAIYRQFNSLSTPLLIRLKRHDIKEGFKRSPDSYYRVLDEIGIKHRKKPSGFWTKEEIEKEVESVIVEHGQINSRLLVSIQRVDLLGAIKKYPGGQTRLKEKFGIEVKAKHPGFWSIDRITQEARSVLDEHGNISYNFLSRIGRLDLVRAVYAYYPGGLIKLKTDLGLVPKQKPAGYWTREKIEEEARAFLKEHQGLSHNLLVGSKRHDLLQAIRKHYLKGLRGLIANLGLTSSKKGAGYWSEERTIYEAREFILENGAITHLLMKQRGRRDLSHAIAKFPGLLNQLKSESVMEDGKKWWGYWTKERIEEQARAFYAKEKTLNKSALLSCEENGLTQAIYSKYPGGMKALKVKLGIEKDSTSVLTEEANEDLSKLLEVV